MKRFTCIPAGAVFDPRLTPALLRLLLALGLYTDKRGRCHVKVATLASVLGTHPKNVQKYMRQLVEFGWVKSTPRYWSHGGQRENVYELVLGGESPTTPPGGVNHDSPHKERVLRTCVERPALSGPDQEDDMNYIDLRETEGPPSTLQENPKKAPTKPKAKTPERLNPVTLAEYTVNKFRQLQWGTPGAVTAKEFGRHYRDWHNNEGVEYREIKTAVDLICDQWPGLDMPIGRVFIKQRFDWITKAKGDIYQQDLPKMKAASRALHQELHQLHAQWLAAHPEADQDAQDRRYSEIWMDLKTDPKYAIAYA